MQCKHCVLTLRLANLSTNPVIYFYRMWKNNLMNTVFPINTGIIIMISNGCIISDLAGISTMVTFEWRPKNERLGTLKHSTVLGLTFLQPLKMHNGD